MWGVIQRECQESYLASLTMDNCKHARFWGKPDAFGLEVRNGVLKPVM